MAVAAVQSRYRFRTDTGTVDGTPSWGAGENTTYVPTPVQHGVAFRIRFEIYNNGTTSTGAQNWNIFAQKNGVGGYTQVTQSRADGIQASAAASSDADNTALTVVQLTNDAPGTPAFVNGQYDNTGSTSAITLGIGNITAQKTELEFGLIITNAALNTDFFDFRVYRGATTALNTYTATPRVTVSELAPFTANAIATAAAAFTVPALNAKVFTGVNLASSAAGVGTPSEARGPFPLAAKFVTAAPILALPDFGFVDALSTALPLSVSAASFDQPAVNFPDVPTIKSISTLPYGSRTNASITPPAGIVDNDILLAYIVNIQIGSEANTTIGAASGFTQIGSDQVVNSGSTFLRGAVYWKRASNESGNYTFTTASGNSEAILIAISGAITSGLVDVSTQAAGSTTATSTTAGSTQSINATAASITTGSAKDLAIYLTSAFSGYASSAPTGINSLLNDIQNGVIFAGWEPEVNAGTVTGPIAMRVNSSADVWLAYLIGVKSDLNLNTLLANSLSAGAAAFTLPAIGQAGGLVAVSIASASAGIVKPAFSQTNKFTTSTLASGSAAFSLPALGSGSLVATSIASNADTLGVPALTTKYIFAATTLAVGAAGLGSPVFNQKDALSTTAIASVAAKLGTPLYGTRSLSATSIATQSAVIQTTSYNQAGAGIATPITSAAAGVGSPIIVQTEILQDAIDLATSASNIGSPTIGWALTASQLAAASATFGLPVFNQKDVMASTAIASTAAAFGSPVLNQSVFKLTAVTLASQAAALSTTTLTQNKNALVASDLASQASRVPTIIWADANKGFVSATDYTTTSPGLDSAAPNLTLTAAFNLGAPNPLALKADGIGKPAINQKQILADAISIASAAFASGLPQFVQFNALDASDLAAGAAGIDSPNIGDTSAVLAAELNFVGVDSRVHQLNTAMTGIVPIPALIATANVAMLVNAAVAADDVLKSIAAIAIAGRSTFRSAAAWTIKERQALVTKATFALGQTLLLSDGTVVFNIAPWTAITDLEVDSVQQFAASVAAANEAVLAINETMLQQTGLDLTGDTALFADIAKQLPRNLVGSSRISPTSILTITIGQTINIAAALQPAAIFRVSVQINITALGLSPVTTLRALGRMRMPASAAISPAIIAAMATSVRMKADAPLGVVSSAVISSILAVNSGTTLEADTDFNAVLVRPSYLALNYNIEPGLDVSEALLGQSFAQLSQEALVSVSELATLGPKAGLVPASVLGAKLQKILSPITLWDAQVSFATNERILPAGTAFYFISPALAINEYQILRPTVPVALQTQLISHEGLRMLQSPTVLHGSAGLRSGDYSIHGPVLQLASDILLDIDGMSNTAATQSDLSSEIDLENQIALWQSLESEIDNFVAMRSLPRMAVAGISSLSPGCFIDPDMTLQHTAEISSMITAQKSQSRIVAQGNLLRKYS